jgi:hypothetical protein
VSHSAKFIEHGVDATWTNEQCLVAQPPGNILGELLACEQFLGKHGVFGQDDADSAMKSNGQARSGRSHEEYGTNRGEPLLPDLRLRSLPE